MGRTLLALRVLQGPVDVLGVVFPGWLFVTWPPSGLGSSLDVSCCSPASSSFFTTGLVTAPFRPGAHVLAARPSGSFFVFPFLGF